MQQVPRLLEQPLRDMFRQYPVVTLTGPRQSGKTTLCRRAFPDLPYVNLEAGDVRAFAVGDPRGFLARLPDGALLDEMQRAPELLSYLQGIVDEARRNGMFVLTGSHQLLLDERISQSLAGRTGILTLLPLTLAEVGAFGAELSTDELIHHGCYPRVHEQRLSPTQAHGDYIATYVERDVRQLSQIRDLTLYRRFIALCAGRIGQLLNLASLGNDVGISHATAREWLSLLEASYVVFRAPPLHANISKRLIKSPKLYFHDVGLASHLLGIENSAQVATHPLRGALFENLVMLEAVKHRTSQGLRSNLHFFRDSQGNEVDGILPRGDGLLAFEVKSGMTVANDWFASLQRIPTILPDRFRGRVLVYDGEDLGVRDGVRVTNLHGFAGVLAEMDAS